MTVIAAAEPWAADDDGGVHGQGLRSKPLAQHGPYLFGREAPLISINVSAMISEQIAPEAGAPNPSRLEESQASRHIECAHHRPRSKVQPTLRALKETTP